MLPGGLVVLSRDGCDLCDEMLHELADLERSQRLPPVTVVDVDSDADLARQYGLKVPVLIAGWQRYLPLHAEFQRAFAAHRPSARYNPALIFCRRKGEAVAFPRLGGRPTSP